MKLRILSVVVLLALCLGLVACQEAMPKEVIGTWTAVGAEDAHTLEIRDDHTLVIHDQTEEPEEDLSVIYRWEDGQLVLESPYADGDSGITLRLEGETLVRYEYGVKTGITYTKN